MANTYGKPESEDTEDLSIRSSQQCTPDGKYSQDALKKAASVLSQTTTLATSQSDGDISMETSMTDLVGIKPDVENALEVKSTQAISLWTFRTIGIPIGGFALAFLNAIAMGVGYGFFLGYLGLDSYVMTSIQALMKLPEVLLLPLGVLNDCVPICGSHRKSYFLLGFVISAFALLLMSVKQLPDPYFCQHADGSYDYTVPPCNPHAHEDKSWYVFGLVLLSVGIQMGVVAGEGLMLEYSQLEPVESRGTIKAEMTIVNLAGALCATCVIGFCMNGKEYLGTFTWGLSFCQLMGACCVLALFLVPFSVFCVYEPPKKERPTLRVHVKASWQLVKQKALCSIFVFAFVVQFLVGINTTAGNNVKSQWAEVKVLQQQLFSMAGVLVMMLTVWVYKAFFLQASWKTVFVTAIVSVTVVDAGPTFMTVFNVVRNQYFFLGEDVINAIPMATLMLLSGLIMIEMAEPGQEGLCYGLIGTLQKSAMPFATVVSNQIFGLFTPSLSNVVNYVVDTPNFRMTVAWSYVLTFGSSLLALATLPLIPRQKAEAQQRKKEWGTSRSIAKMVVVLPATCLIYGVVVLVLASSPETACQQLAGGPGC